MREKIKVKENWIPKTELGKKVMEGKITSMQEIFENGWKIKEPEIVDKLLPNLETELIYIGGTPGKGGGIKRTPTRRTSRMHRSGRRYRISACAVVGSDGYIGIAKATAKEHLTAIEKATEAAKLSVIPVRKACGSWECACGEPHSIPLRVKGKNGAVEVVLLPAPKGVGLAIGDEGKKLLRLAGIKDIWSKVYGDTRTRLSYTFAIYNAFKNLNKMRFEGREKVEEKTQEEEYEPETEEELKEIMKDVDEEEVGKMEEEVEEAEEEVASGNPEELVKELEEDLDVEQADEGTEEI